MSIKIVFLFSKSSLRKRFRQIRNNHIHQNSSILHSCLSLRLASILKKYRQAKIIGSYIFAIDQQIIPPTIQGYKYAFPYFKPKTSDLQTPLMEFKIHQIGYKYYQRVYGIKIPNKKLPTVFPEIVLVPLLCFNPYSKQRIGYGGGYYDKYINYCRSNKIQTAFVGIAYQCLKQKTNFSSENDQTLDYIITQKQIY